MKNISEKILRMLDLKTQYYWGRQIMLLQTAFNLPFYYQQDKQMYSRKKVNSSLNEKDPWDVHNYVI